MNRLIDLLASLVIVLILIFLLVKIGALMGLWTL